MNSNRNQSPRVATTLLRGAATAVVLAAATTASAATTPAAAAQVELFPLQSVRLLDGPFRDAQQADRTYMLAHSVDRLLAPFRREAGLPQKAPPYGSWETGGLDGHTGGHYLTALAEMYASTGDPEMKRRMDYMVADLAECQRVNGDGYVGGVPRGRALWAEVAGRQDQRHPLRHQRPVGAPGTTSTRPTPASATPTGSATTSRPGRCWSA